MMSDLDVTDQVSFYDNDGESLPLIHCVCGKDFDAWEKILGVERDFARECVCGRRLYFRNSIKVFEVVDGN
jgi:hypothetical protein